MSTARPASLIPPSYLPYLANTTGALAIIPAAIGIASLLNPPSALARLRFPRVQADHAVTNGVTRLVGARNLAVGLANLLLWWKVRRGEVGYSTFGSVALLTMGTLVTADGWVVKDVAGEGEWEHWGFLPVVAALGLGLMGVY